MDPTGQVQLLPPLLPEDGSRASFRNVVFLKKKRWIQSKNKTLRKNKEMLMKYG
jgi:hypothetical protein